MQTCLVPIPQGRPAAPSEWNARCSCLLPKNACWERSHAVLLVGGDNLKPEKKKDFKGENRVVPNWEMPPPTPLGTGEAASESLHSTVSINNP